MLRPYQKRSIDATILAVRDGNPLVVAPTGSGKSHIIAGICTEVLARWPTTKILILAHRRELIKQNAEKLLLANPDLPLGIYSAGLKKKEINSVTIAGIQSIYKIAKDLPKINLVIIDEAHLLPMEGEGMYRQLLAELQTKNPKLRCIGLTATPWRTSTGPLTVPSKSDAIQFHSIAYEIKMSELIAEKFLSPFVAKLPKTQGDLSKAGIKQGEFIQKDIEEAMDKEDLTLQAITECERFARDRKSWLVFCSGVAHAEHVTAKLKERGHNAECITGAQNLLFRDEIIDNFKKGKLKCLVGCDIFTTGFDAPNVDALILLRPTLSPGLFVQIVGRGSRIAATKKDCLILDFAGNLERFGPVDLISSTQRMTSAETAKKKSTETIKVSPVKICLSCRSIALVSAKECADCGAEFPEPAPILKHKSEAYSGAVLSTDNKPEVLLVHGVTYSIHQKAGGFPCLKAVYRCEKEDAARKLVFEFISFDSPMATKHAHGWWAQHTDNLIFPKNTAEAASRISELKSVHAIQTVRQGKWDRIIGLQWGKNKEEEARDYFWDKFGVNL